MIRIAIPLTNGTLSPHFGHCERFALVDVDDHAKSVIATESLPSPDHEPGLLPRWLADLGAKVIIAGGMGGRARQLFEQSGISVIVGAPSEQPETLAKRYLDGTLSDGDNLCDH